ncbi:MAG: 2-dehydro-3-deoxyphosphooctonate aldolase, partial [Verrucomicrobiaceae bacterium]|nr:2-dehydro-3-deoxyphosphooctonate aldolase [Verrucomicrobiaceae bacterium]
SFRRLAKAAAWVLCAGFFVMISSPAAASTPVDPAPAHWQELTPEQRLADLHHRRRSSLENNLQAAGFSLGSPAFIRVFKESSELELWLQKPGAAAFEPWRTYAIAKWSGTLGPKQKEGDGQAPEGFYSVARQRLNPGSKYHLSFNIGYPNAYDLAHGCTGGLIMVHGKNVSIGCFAMTDPVIEEIYLIVEAALAAGQAQVPVHSFPFRLTEERLAQARAEGSPWVEFWSTGLRPAWQAFEQTHMPPTVRQGLRYEVEAR